MPYFDFIEQYKDAGLALPERKTAQAAGYDFMVAEDTLIPPIDEIHRDMLNYHKEVEPLTLSEMADISKHCGRPTLVPTGVKCHLDPDTYLQLSVRSSSSLKSWLFLANGTGIIDADYWNNPRNEGHIFFQIVNFSPFPIILKKGEYIGQGIILPYLKVNDDDTTTERIGGFGSTTK